MRPHSWLPVALSACYAPSFDPCAVQCETGDRCPGGTSCASDGFCHHAGEPMCTPDATPVDAAVDAAPDAPPDAMRTPPTVRLLRNAFFSSWSGTTFSSSAGMSTTGFEVATYGIADGDLIVFVGSIDNDGAMIWPDPIAPGFTQLVQQTFGNDAQSFVVAWKLAAGEPATYTGTYGAGVGSGSAVITLLAVQGADPLAPIRETRVTTDSGPDIDPVLAASTGLSVDAAACAILFAAGVDWANHDGTTTFDPPAGFTQLAALSDRGTATFDWTSHQVASTIQPSPGLTGPLTATFDSPHPGVAWSVALAIAPQ